MTIAGTVMESTWRAAGVMRGSGGGGVTPFETGSNRLPPTVRQLRIF